MPSLRSESFMLAPLVHNLKEIQSLCSVNPVVKQQEEIVIREMSI